MSQAGVVNAGGGGGIPVETLTGNTGGAIPPDVANNINVIGSGGISVAGNPGTHTLTISGGDYISLSPYIVGQTGDTHAGYTGNTGIQAAINAAIADGATANNRKNVYIKPGTYTSNLLMRDGICLIAFSPRTEGVFTTATSPIVKIVGNHTIGATSFWCAQNINFTASNNALPLFDYTGGAGNVSLDNCNCSVVNQPIFAAASGNLEVDTFNCNMSAGSIFSYFNVLNSVNYTLIDFGSAFSCISMFDMTGADSSFQLQSISRLDDTNTDCTNFVLDPGGSAANIQLFAQDCYAGLVFSITTVFSGVNSPSISIQCYNCNVQGTVTALNSTTTTIELLECRGFTFPIFNVANNGTVRKRIVNFTDQQHDSVINLLESSSTPLFTGSQSVHKQSQIQTTDATPIAIDAIFLNNLESITVKGTITGSTIDHTNSCGGDFLITARRAAAANITLVGSIVTNVNSTTTATFTVDVVVAGQSVRILVTGIAATTYNWVTDYTYQKVLTSA